MGRDAKRWLEKLDKLSSSGAKLLQVKNLISNAKKEGAKSLLIRMPIICDENGIKEQNDYILELSKWKLIELHNLSKLEKKQ